MIARWIHPEPTSWAARGGRFWDNIRTAFHLQHLPMISSNWIPKQASRAWLLLLSIAIPLAVLANLGMDNNWDLHNYHLYNPHAWLHGRMATDIAAAQLQSFHNPLLDMPLYLMVRAGLPGTMIGLWLCLPFMVALYCLLRLYALACPEGAAHFDSLVLALLASTGAAASMAMGASYNDAFVAAGALGSILLLAGEHDENNWRRWCAAGVLAGAVAGLKLTASVYCLGLAAAALFAMPLSRSPMRLAALLAGGLLGFALTYGYWGWLLYQQHGNPVFPYFNHFFMSPDALPVAHTDLRFRPASLVDLVMIPVRLLNDTRRYSELILRDPRLLLGILTLAILLVRNTRRVDGAGDHARLRLIAAFFMGSLVIWALQYGIYRYLLPLEMLACLGVALFVAQLPRTERSWMSLLVLLLAVAGTNAPLFGRKPFGQPMAQVSLPVLPAGSMVVISGSAPLGMVVSRLPDAVPAIAVYNNLLDPRRCTQLQVAAGQRLLAHQGPLWLLRESSPSGDEGERLLGLHYGLRTGSNCYPVASDSGKLQLCQLHREQAKAACITVEPGSPPGIDD